MRQRKPPYRLIELEMLSESNLYYIMNMSFKKASKKKTSTVMNSHEVTSIWYDSNAS